MISNTAKIARNTLYQVIGKVLGTGFGIFSFALTSRYLGPELFGAYSTAITYVGLFATFADLGFPVLHLRLRAQGNRFADIANLNSLRVLGTALILGIAIAISPLFGYSPEVQTGILITALGYVAVSFTQYITAIFQEKLRTARAASAEVLGRAAMFGVVLLAVRLDLGLPTIYWAVTIGSAVAFILTLLLVSGLARIRLSWMLGRWPVLLREASPLVLLTAFQIVYFKIDTLLLAGLHGNQPVGIYSAAYKFIDVLVTFPVLFTTLVLPFMTRAASPQQRTLLASRFSRALTAVVMAAVPVVAVTAVEADRLVALFSGSAYLESGLLLRALSVAVLPLFIGNLATMTLIGLHRAGTVAWLFGVAATLGTAAYIVTILPFAEWGAAWTTVGVELLIAVVSLAAVLRITRSVQLFRLGLSALGGIIAAGIMLIAGSLPLLVTLTLGMSGYVMVLFVTRALTLREVLNASGFMRTNR